MSSTDARAAQAIGRSRGGLTTKIHTLADGRGRSLATRITPGQAADTQQLIPLLDQVRVPDPASLAVTSTGTALAWGYNNSGQLGDGTNTNRLAPVSVALPLGADVAAMVASRIHSAALTSAGTVFAGGDNSAGQLGSE